MILESIENFAKLFLEEIKNPIHIISHFDTDGITSAAILCKTLERLNKQFSIKIIKQLTQTEIDLFPKEKTIILLDLGSGSIDLLALKNKIFIIDHHEIDSDKIPSDLIVINPLMFNENQNTCASALTYLFSKEMNILNTDLASLAIIGMISEYRDAKSSNVGEEILKDAIDMKIKKSILLLPATRPLHKALEFSNIFIPGITGSAEGVFKLLNQTGIKLKEEENARSLLDLNEEETSKLLEMLCIRKDDDAAFGNIYLVKFFNQFEDAREISTLINACGRMEKGHTALEMCIGSKKAKSAAESIYGEYKHLVISSLKIAASIEKIETENYVLINSGQRINDNLLSVVISTMASSFVYPNGKVLIGLADRNDGKIKVSSRICGECKDLNLKSIIEPLLIAVEGEGSGNTRSAGGIIPKERESEFIALIQNNMNQVLAH